MIIGVDVSHWQGQMDWAKCAQKAKYAFIRAGSIDQNTGKCYADHRFEENAAQAHKHLPVGYYWYFRPQWQPTAQAEFFADLIRTQEWKLPAVCDFENSGGMLPKHVEASLRTFLLKMEELLGDKPLIYTSPNAWKSYAAAPAWGLHYGLWEAHYTTADKPLPIPPWPTYEFWQYTDKGPGREYGAASSYIDLNRCEDKVLAQYVGAEPEVVPPDDGLAAYVAVLEDRIDRIEEWIRGFDE